MPVLREQFPDVVFRVHLARDLEFLIPDLVDAGWEVRLAGENSVTILHLVLPQWENEFHDRVSRSRASARRATPLAGLRI